MSDNGYMDLWQFLREVVAPEESANVDAHWLAATSGKFYPDELYEARAQILDDVIQYDPLMELHSQDDVDVLTKSQVFLNRERWRAEVERLLEQELPKSAKARLSTGDYEITARRLGDGTIVELTPRDLASLDLDIQNKQLHGSAGLYGEIAIRRRAAEPKGQKRRSHRPTRDRARKAMQDDIAAGAETLETLEKMTQQYRAERYGVNRETAMLALADLVARQTATSTG